MADKKEARNVYECVAQMLDEKQYKYKRDDENLEIRIVLRGEDIPMDFSLKIDSERDLVIFSSILPFKIKGESLVAAAVAVCNINYYLADGSFDLDVRDGELSFKLTSSYKDSLLSKESLTYMFELACFTLDKYNDKLLFVNEGQMSPFDVTED